MTKSGVLIPEALPEFLTTFPDIVERIDSFLDLAPDLAPDLPGGEANSQRTLGINQILVNEYQPHQGISPHEDGPAFRPLVATLTLGSHQILDIHHYISATSPSPPMTTSQVPLDPERPFTGQPIAAIPLAHLLLLPRSLLVLSSSLYAAHLHGIAPRSEDIVVTELPKSPGEVRIVNGFLLGDASIVDSLRETGHWEGRRGVRTSLTFRHAQKVLKGGAFNMTPGGIKRGSR